MAKLFEIRGNMDLPMVEERAGLALWSGEWSGWVHIVLPRMGEEAGCSAKEFGKRFEHLALSTSCGLLESQGCLTRVYHTTEGHIPLTLEDESMPNPYGSRKP